MIDIRANGGGDIIKSVFLTRYLRNTPFKVADTAEAISNNLSPYTRYISHGFFNNIGLFFVTHKEKDGKYHFGYWERHTFKPKRKNHFNGNVYVLTNGLTFSNTFISLFLLTHRIAPLMGEERIAGHRTLRAGAVPGGHRPLDERRASRAAAAANTSRGVAAFSDQIPGANG